LYDGDPVRLLACEVSGSVCAVIIDEVDLEFPRVLLGCAGGDAGLDALGFIAGWDDYGDPWVCL
jgi:hypothetical protein